MTDSEVKSDFIWKRPNDVPYPNVWRTYEATSKAGSKYKIKIQDIPSDRFSEVVDFMDINMDRYEPFTKAVGVCKDNESAASYRMIKRKVLEQKVSLMAVFDEEGKPNIKPDIIGVLLLNVKSKGDLPLKPTGTLLKRLFGFIDNNTKDLDVFKILQSDKFVYHMGVVVAPKYYGLGAGLELEIGASCVGKAFGLKGSFIWFSSVYSQCFIEKLGCKLFKEVRYDEYKDENGEVIPVEGTPSSKFVVWEYT